MRADNDIAAVAARCKKMKLLVKAGELKMNKLMVVVSQAPLYPFSASQSKDPRF